MRTHASATFEIKAWDEKPSDEFAGGRKITRAGVKELFHGGIEGEGSLEYLMAYGRQPQESPMFGFTNEQIYRYSRHIILPDLGGAGQKKLLNAKVLIVGAGGLGSPAAMYLAAAGVGTLGLVDFDRVDLSNLQRQLLHRTKDVGRPKLDSAEETLNALNPDVRVNKHAEVLTSANVMQVIRDYDIVVNGTDNFPTRYLVNDACVFSGKPLVDGSIFMFEGQATVYDAKRGPCYRCLFPTPPPPGEVPSCQEAGVLGVLPGIIGSIQAIEVIKLVLDKGAPLIGRLLLFDALPMEFREMQVDKDPHCPVCGEDPTITELIDYEQFCGVPFPETKQEVVPA